MLDEQTLLGYRGNDWSAPHKTLSSDNCEYGGQPKFT